MSRQVMRVGVFVTLALLLALGVPAWAFGGGTHVHFGLSFGRQGGAIFLFESGHPSVLLHPPRGFLVFGFQPVWVPGGWMRTADGLWIWAPGPWVKIPRGFGVWVPGRWIVIDP